MNEQPPEGADLNDAQRFRIGYLVAGFIRQSLTEAEHLELDDWVTTSMENQRLFEKMIDQKNIDAGLKQLQSIDTEAALQRFKNRISVRRPGQKAAVRSLWIYAAAAMVIAMVMIGFLMLGDKKKNVIKQDSIAINATDIAPGSNHAILLIADGSIIQLDSIKTGLLPVHGNETITKRGSGELSYAQTPSLVSHVNQYNTLTVPAGGQYKLVLPDGTRVWLNAASSLKYPVVFGGPKRLVELTGEGYFEVAKDATHPFEVMAAGSLIQVLGTHFSVNAYTDEPQIRIVLAEGSVKLNKTTVLKPGEQGSVDRDGAVKITTADVESNLAWTKGQFNFRETPLPEILRQIARWYGASIDDRAQINDHFNAQISRDVPVSKLLHYLEGTGSVHFKIEDKKITVMK
jgi:transmembrane sensor